MIEACDQADAAAYATGTPVRTQSFRAHIDAVTTDIQRIEFKSPKQLQAKTLCAKGRRATSPKPVHNKPPIR
jgi:hypothetical protein